jgi:hypothetical protein
MNRAFRALMADFSGSGGDGEAQQAKKKECIQVHSNNVFL